MQHRRRAGSNQELISSATFPQPQPNARTAPVQPCATCLFSVATSQHVALCCNASCCSARGTRLPSAVIREVSLSCSRAIRSKLCIRRIGERCRAVALYVAQSANKGPDMPNQGPDMHIRVVGQSGAHGFTSSRRSSSLKVTITSCESKAERPVSAVRLQPPMRNTRQCIPSTASAASLPRRSNECSKPGRARCDAAASNQFAPLPRFGSVARGRGERACAAVADLGANRAHLAQALALYRCNELALLRRANCPSLARGAATLRWSFHPIRCHFAASSRTERLPALLDAHGHTNARGPSYRSDRALVHPSMLGLVRRVCLPAECIGKDGIDRRGSAERKRHILL